MASQFDRINAAVKAVQDNINRKALVSISRRVIVKTPVDTGEARTGWQFDINRKPSGEPSGDPIDAITLAVQPMKVGEVGFFINVVPHIIPLEWGYSDQAPNGMLRLSVAQWDSIVARAAKEVK